MRNRHLIPASAGAIIAVLALLSPPAPASAKPRAPTAVQVRTALAAARHSRYLWATVNICDTARHPNMIGIRGQMPSLGFAARLGMQVTLSYWSSRDGRFEPVPGVSRHVDLGPASTGSRQGGVILQFTPPAVLIGAIRFDWTRSGRVIGQATRVTAAGYKHVDEADPPGYSTAICRIN